MNSTRVQPLAVGVLSLALVGSPASARAQETPPIRSGFELVPFQFFPPGARSLGMGATFVAVADDATASSSNPAGLVILSSPEISAHGRFTSYSGASVAVGGTPATTFDYDVASPSFFSAVVPLGPVRIAGYYQTAARARPSLFQPQTPDIQVQNGMDLLVDDIGGSVAVKLGPRAAIGLSVASRRVHLSYFMEQSLSGSRVSATDELIVGAGADGTLTPVEAHDIVLNAGLLLNPNGRLSGGFTYKSGGDFSFPYEVTVAGFSPEKLACPNTSENPCGAASLRLPDTFAAGLAFRPNGRWLFSVDLNYIRYSRYGESSLRGAPVDQYPPNTEFFHPASFKDVAQFNAGIEYTIPWRTPLSLRAGAWHRPSYSDVVAPATFVTAGAGLVVHDHFQIDSAVSVSEDLWESVLSMVLRF